MKDITEEQYDKLSKACDELLKKNASLERNANAYLHIIREHPIFLQNYIPLFNLKDTKFTIHLLKQLCLNIIKGLYKLIESLYRNYILGEGLANEHRSFENLFLSHFLNDSFIYHRSNFYFFELPKRLQKIKLPSLQLFINFTDRNSKYVNNKWRNRDVVSQLLPKYLPLTQELKIRFLFIKDAITIIKTKTNSNFERRLKYQAAVTSLSSETHFNYRLAILIQKYVKKNGIKRIFITYEGQPWERLIFAMARRIENSVECIGYQHALIFRKQHAILRKLENNFEPDYILFSGIKGLNIFKKIKYLPSNRLILFGTDRIGPSKTPKIKTRKSNKNTFLILPEGDLIECIPLAKLMIQLAHINYNFKFIIRFHPITNIKKVIQKCPELNYDYPNIELSKLSLEDDLKRSDFAIYRGSTTIIKAVQSGLIPLYYEKKNEMSIDPLFKMKKAKINLCQNLDLEFIFKTSIDEIEKNQSIIMNHVKDFFSPIDYDKIDEILKL